MAKPIPDGYQQVIPFLRVNGVAKLVEFCKRAFDAGGGECMEGPDGTVMHAELRIGDCVVMLGEPRGDMQAMPSVLYHYVTDCDAVYARALEAGGQSIMPPTTQFYGDRHAGITDPSGNMWWIATRVEDVPPEEMARRHKAFLETRRKA